MIFNKLVRDKIPEIMVQNNQIANIKILNEEEYQIALESKLREEVEEFIKDKNKEELADILEVLDAIIHNSNYKWDEIIKIKKEKKIKRGGFTDRIFLLDRID